MKQASGFEKIAARCWNMLNEGKPFTPIFIVGTMLLYHISSWGDLLFWQNILLSFTVILPMVAMYYIYDFPLLLRNYLWLPFVAYLMIFNTFQLSLLLFALGLYFFFTVWFWGTFYYHLRIGTSWLNFTRFWKLVLKNSDSTSGNAQEQMPKFLLLLSLWQLFYEQFAVQSAAAINWQSYLLFIGGVLLYSVILHRNLFDWKPKQYTTFTNNIPMNSKAMNKRVITIVIDGMRKDRFQAADTPFLDTLRKNGTEYTQMETVYPARTVVCFTSMMTGTYPYEHGIKSNMVWKLGTKVETVFDSLRKVGKSGRLLGIAHLVDSMGDDVDTVTAVMNNDVADYNIIERAKVIMKEKNPDFFKVQLIGTDQTGHSRGVLYDEYLEKIAEADRLVEDFVKWLEENGYMENTTLIICADHGQADGIGGHGHLDEGERFVPFFMHGPTIEKGKIVEEKHSLVSLAPTITYLLGAPFPSHSRGPVLTEAIKKQGKEEAS
ncbi:alkaline phosphatase family protein [Bacillus taeanensis]|uniref:Alkaline phosphatase family protein n=1 Tax=Bacillus taeanensis TaxID=273032 RepID=A0A366Y021_9BACI|nr:alkaline phosphatase family protein [Bacillus taeanensis]RBW71537.1 alkaline phosphatase family protein [Bacillus taeanensis]